MNEHIYQQHHHITYDLSHGLRVIVVEWHSLPMVHVDLMIKAGTYSEPEEKSGLARATAFLLTQGTHLRSAMRIAEEIDFIGAKLYNDSKEDASYLSISVLKKHLPKSLELFKDLIVNPLFHATELERWQKRTIASIAQEKADPSTVATKKFKKFAFGGYPYGNSISEQSVNRITQDDVKNFYGNFYKPNNAVLAIVGDIDSQQIAKDIQKLLEPWNHEPVPITAPHTPPEASGFLIQLINKEDLNQAQIRFGWPSIKRNNPDYFPIVLLNYILGGGGFSSRLMKEIRSSRGYTYGINSNFNFYRYSGLFVIATFTKNEIVPSMLQEIKNQLKLITEKGITDEELHDAKSFFKGSFARRFERPDLIADQMLDLALYELDNNYLNTFKSNIDAVTREQIHQAIHHYILTDSAHLVIVGKSQDYAHLLATSGSIQHLDYHE
jgi:zinc protease